LHDADHSLLKVWFIWLAPFETRFV